MGTGSSTAVARLGESSSRERILDAAEDLFARRGYAGVGLREVAEEVGLGKSSLFHHFPNKPELYAAVCARILERIDTGVARSLARPGPAAERFLGAIDDLVLALSQRPGDARILLRSLFEDDDLPGESAEQERGEAFVKRIVSRVEAVVQEGIAAGGIRPANPRPLLLLVVGLVVFPAASGEFGDELIGGAVQAPQNLARIREETRRLLAEGLVIPVAG